MANAMNPLPHKNEKMKKLNNTVIKNLSPEMGKRIIEKYQADGWDTRTLDGSSSVALGNESIYYGVINDYFGFYLLEQVQFANARIIDLDEFIPKRGDMVMVWDGDENEGDLGEYIQANFIVRILEANDYRIEELVAAE